MRGTGIGSDRTAVARATDAGWVFDRKAIPNDYLVEAAGREECQLLNLCLSRGGEKTMAMVARAIKPEMLWNEFPAFLLSTALAIMKANGGHQPTRPAFESAFASLATTPEESAGWTVQLDMVYHQYFGLGPGDAERLTKRVADRARRRDAYWAAVDAQGAILQDKSGEDADRSMSKLRDILSRPAASTPGRAFECWRLSDLSSHQPNPADSIAGDGWLRGGAGCLVTGGTGLGKSVLVEQLCVSAAAGIPFVGIMMHRPVRVLYVQAENDADTLKRDVLSIVRNADGKPCPVLVQANLSIVHAYGLDKTGFADWISASVEEHRPDLVVVDPYQSFIGGANINDSSSFLEWIRPIDSLIKSRGIAMVLVVHTTKPADRSNWTERESVYMAAGSSTIANWCRTSCELTQKQDDDSRYRLRFGKNAERTGLCDEQGGIVRDIYLEHSGDRSEPFWRVSESQTPFSGGKFTDSIIKAKIENPKASMATIADSVGCSKATVHKVLTMFLKGNNPNGGTVGERSLVHRSPLKGGERSERPFAGAFSERSVNGNEQVNEDLLEDSLPVGDGLFGASTDKHRLN